MRSFLVTNNDGGHLKAILSGMETAKRVVIHVAFLKSSGLSLIEKSLKKALESGASIEVVAGLDFYQTEPIALWSLYNIMKEYSNAFTLHLASQDKATFHPKLYFWENSGQAAALIGSANMTCGGLKENVELSVMIEGEASSPLLREFRDYLSGVLNSKRVRKATSISLSQYEARHTVYAKRQKQAEEDAKAETSKLFKFNEDKLNSYLEEYRANKDEQEDFLKRRKHYKAAKNLLDKMATEQIGSKRQFLLIYDQLVGSQGQASLLHSSGLQRSKSRVVDNYKRFIKLVQDLRKNIEKNPADVLDIGLKHANEIVGVGINLLTELIHTYDPRRFAVLNQNQVVSLADLGFPSYGTTSKNSFSGAKYSRFNGLITDLAKLCKFEDLSQVDHFLNFVYWNYARRDA